MRKLFQYLFRRPVTWFANKVSSRPVKKDVFESMDILLDGIRNGKEEYGFIQNFDLRNGKFIIFSDQHKGAKDAADDFRNAEANYHTALDYYFKNGFCFANIGDCEELWENTPDKVVEQSRKSLLEEARFLQEGRYFRTFGNHDLEWKYAFQRDLYLEGIFGKMLRVPEGILLCTTYNNEDFSILLTHGHQGDKQSDGNKVSMWIVAAIWTPIQRFLDISVNTTSDSFDLVDEHNIMMYEWSATQKNLLLISGHTHKPVFASLDHIERLLKQIDKAKELGNITLVDTLEKELNWRRTEYGEKKFVKTMVAPTYFNTGCCCFSDGDITGIEIEGDNIRLVKWQDKNGNAERLILEQCPLSYLFDSIRDQVATVPTATPMAN
ncbi:MAG: metallophosphoesterase [Chitinophagaceae bacterium]|nr:MAG: metallophosphoesterase [Chitinophagaceae bacterium]